MTASTSHGARRFGFSTLILALSMALPAAHAAQVFDQPDPDFNGRIRAAGVVLPGVEATLEGTGFAPGQEIILARGLTVLNEKAPYKANDKGEFQAKLAIPQDAIPGTHPLVITVNQPYASAIFPLKISPVIPVSGADKFQSQSQKLVPGLYQVAYSPKNNALYVTSAVGRPPVKASKLLKLNPETLAIEAQVDALPVEGRDDGHLYAVYGVAVDDINGNVWTTNTRDDTVAVYRASDLGLVKQFEKGVLPHGRDIIVDTKHGKVYASAVGSDTLSVFDAKTLARLPDVKLPSSVRGEEFSPASLALDSLNDKLYTVSLSTNEVAVVDTTKGATETTFLLPGAKSAIGVDVDPQGQRLYVVSQGSDNLQIIDLAKNAVLHDVKTGAGPLNVDFDSVSQLAYITNRGSGTVTVVDADGNIVANLDAGSFPNHVRADNKGNIFVINKAKGADDPTGDRITRLTPKR